MPPMGAAHNPVRTLRPNLHQGGRTAHPADLPRIEMVVGSDSVSAGCTVTFYGFGELGKLLSVDLVAERWQDKPQTQEELLMLAYKALEWHLKSEGALSE